MQAVVAAIRDNERFVVTSHEAPDGDALGSLLAMGLALEQLGKDVVMFLGGEAPLPGEYRFLELERRGLRRERPADFGERVLVALDCASAGRVGAEPGLVSAAPFTVNIDHHELWQRSKLAVACATREHGELQNLLDAVERFLGSQGYELLRAEREVVVPGER